MLKTNTIKNEKVPVAPGRPEQCSVDYAFQRIGGKYKARILWHLYDGTKRYGELRRHLPDITAKMLTQALRELEADQLIKRQVYLEVPPKVEYSLDGSGRDLVPAIELLSGWARIQMEKNNIPVMPYKHRAISS
ncbi:helix-turn-helix domain-containing protein [Flavitalea sp. BT771]|uniref:winged helix-turn-helix transcriptional regulator n=1 Tax=Flavitalea sp. BT771 TaxID=3063329 RepID=UPI0026E3245C|nr:helix-turn-helix domain-containing protein [Flavitalea sp. BT771]MDO6435158.1 helix-turn-helix domain-containing protein [Flavitalea sp. BT771]MDV6224137.1 helix-turn-helix domain-containing protein [Flavitalea sp. BT771]